MTQLQTPISFADELSAFDEPRPLSLRDVVLPRLTLPVGGVDPVGAGQAVKGKLLEANQRGGQLIAPTIMGQSYETLSITWTSPDQDFRTLTFAQTVTGIAIEIIRGGPAVIYWCPEATGAPYVTYDTDGLFWMTFRGTVTKWRRSLGVGNSTINLWGFY